MVQVHGDYVRIAGDGPVGPILALLAVVNGVRRPQFPKEGMKALLFVEHWIGNVHKPYVQMMGRSLNKHLFGWLVKRV